MVGKSERVGPAKKATEHGGGSFEPTGGVYSAQRPIVS